MFFWNWEYLGGWKFDLICYSFDGAQENCEKLVQMTGGELINDLLKYLVYDRFLIVRRNSFNIYFFILIAYFELLLFCISNNETPRFIPNKNKLITEVEQLIKVLLINLWVVQTNELIIPVITASEPVSENLEKFLKKDFVHSTLVWDAVF